MSVHSGKALDVMESETTDKINVAQYERNESMAQKWVINENKTIVNPMSGKALTVDGATSDKTNVVIDTLNWSHWQIWEVRPYKTEIEPEQEEDF